MSMRIEEHHVHPGRAAVGTEARERDDVSSVKRVPLFLVLAGLLTACLVFSARCSDVREHALLPPRAGASDTGGITSEFRSSGGPARVTLTGWVKPDVVSELEAAGLGAPPGHDHPATLQGMPNNALVGLVPPGGVDRVAELPYVVEIEPAPDIEGGAP